MNLLLSPHDDDSVLFASFLCLREKPVVVIVTDAYIQTLRGEIGCDARTRAKETEKAHAILGVPTIRLGIHDNLATEEVIASALGSFKGFDAIYAPALQGGNVHHDMVSKAASYVFGKVKQYTTYTKTELWTKGTEEIIPTDEELNLKYKAMAQYESQVNLPSTQPHFLAVINQSEWLI